jgi:hypothetical protein
MVQSVLVDVIQFLNTTFRAICHIPAQFVHYIDYLLLPIVISAHSD